MPGLLSDRLANPDNRLGRTPGGQIILRTLYQRRHAGCCVVVHDLSLDKPPVPCRRAAEAGATPRVGAGSLLLRGGPCGRTGRNDPDRNTGDAEATIF